MSQPTDTPASPTPDVAQQLAQLTESVNRLVQAQQQQQQQPTIADIGGAIPGGAAPRSAVDIGKLSPLQQITLGLRESKPVGPVQQAAHDTAPSGAD